MYPSMNQDHFIPPNVGAGWENRMFSANGS
jgi:hypothetical protein